MDPDDNHSLMAIITALLILMSLIGMFLLNFASAQLFDDNVSISNSQKSSQQQIASDGNHVYIVWRDETTGNGDIYFRKSSNFGRNFDPVATLVKNIEISSEPKVVSDGNHVYIVWRDETTGNGDIYFKRSIDNGFSFEKREYIFQNNGSSSEPQIASDGRHVYIVWRDETTGNGDIYFKRSTDNGFSFEKRKYIFQSNGSSSEPQIASDDRHVYIAWRDETTGNGDIYFRKSSNYAKNFSRTVQITGSEGSSLEPQIASDGNHVYIVWRDETTGNGDIYFSSSSNSGDHFEFPKNLAVTRESSSQPQIASDGNHVYIVWRDETTGNGDIYFRQSSKHGNDFEDIKKLHEGNGSSSEPQMRTDQNNLYILWTESTFNNSRLLFQSSRNFGYDFYNAVDLSSNFTLSHYPKLDLFNGTVYVVWRDGNKIGDTGISFKRISEE